MISDTPETARKLPVPYYVEILLEMFFGIKMLSAVLSAMMTDSLFQCTTGADAPPLRLPPRTTSRREEGVWCFLS